MTLMKERAVEMIQRMPEDNMVYVINILQSLEAMSVDKENDKRKAQMALMDILSMEKRLPEDFDPQKELQEARTEKYENFRISDLNAEKIISAIDNDAFTDFEDCLQEECAVESMADYIVTRNPEDYKKSRVRVIEPDEFVKLL